MDRSIRELGLFRDKGNLSHTRGAPLESLLRLVELLYEHGPLTENLLVAKAIQVGVRGFALSSKTKSQTRIRHFLYSLVKLCLAYAENDTWYLQPFGMMLAEEARCEQCTNKSSSERVRRAFREVLSNSPYVRQLWLDHMTSSRDRRFRIVKVSATESCELLHDLGSYGEQDAQDSGYTFYPSGVSRWRDLCLFAPNQNPELTIGFILSETARKEIVEGARTWTNEVNLTDEVPAFEGLEIDQGCISRDLVAFRVDNHVLDLVINTGELAAYVATVIKQDGDGSRIRIPQLIARICLDFRTPVLEAKRGLIQLHESYASWFYFEGASQSVISISRMHVADPMSYFLEIDGIWRPSILMH